MPSGLLNPQQLRKMIQKKNLPKKIPELKVSTLVLPPKVVENRAQAELEKKEKLAKKRLDDIKSYKRSLKSIWVAKYIETNMGVPFMEICEGIETKNSKILKLVKEVKQELVDEKFGVEVEEEEESGEE